MPSFRCSARHKPVKALKKLLRSQSGKISTEFPDQSTEPETMTASSIFHDSGISSGDDSRELSISSTEIDQGLDEDNLPPSSAFFRESIKKKIPNRGRIMVSIGKHAPTHTSTLLRSSPLQIGGLHWYLQIVLNRNAWTGRTRFLSLYICCEDLPLGECVTVLVQFRLVSQVEGSPGMTKEIIAKLDGSSPEGLRHAGIANFNPFREIFANDSDYICPQLGNEAQIEASIRVKSRQPIQGDSCIPSPSLEHFEELNLLLLNTLEGKSRVEDLKKDEEPMEVDSSPSPCCSSAYSSAKENIREEGEERQTKTTVPNPRKNAMRMAGFEEEEDEGEDGDEGLGQTGKSKIGESKECASEFEEAGGNVVDMCSGIGQNGKNEAGEEEGALFSWNVKKKVQGSKITDFFPSRRSCRIAPSYLEGLRLEQLKEQVKLATHEPMLDVFESPTKGRGLRTRKQFAKDAFVVEYKGDFLNGKQAQQREKKYARKPSIGCYMFYFTHNEKKWCIDATRETLDKGRLVNHSRLAPNMKAKVFDLGDDDECPHLCLVALRPIKIGEELTFDYGDRTPLTVEKHPWLANT